ncbi:hypothetical protein HGRIS_004346 [Hohenbuehelia grisea]|uniref:Uncharacterized protein n=1 Tax=Hohenbuehelia grisea TaxID=104357 RepID=A0ABR3IPI2_9AGAR
MRCYRNLSVTSPIKPLVFLNDPLAHGAFVRSEDLSIPNVGLHALFPGSQANFAYLQMENRLCELFSLARTQAVPSPRRQQTVAELRAEFCRLNDEKAQQWARHRAPAGTVNTGSGDGHRSIRNCPCLFVFAWLKNWFQFARLAALSITLHHIVLKS